MGVSREDVGPVVLGYDRLWLYGVARNVVQTDRRDEVALRIHRAKTRLRAELSPPADAARHRSRRPPPGAGAS